MSGTPAHVYKPGLMHWSFIGFTAGATVSNIGGMVQRVVVTWVVWEMTRSSFWVGVIAVCEFAPNFFLTPFAGAALDRLSMRKVLAATQVVGFVQALLLFLLWRWGMLDLPLIIALTLVFAVANSFYTPSLLTIVPLLIEREQISRAISINAILVNVLLFVSPLLAALLIETRGPDWGFGLNAVTYLVLLAVLPTIVIGERKRSPAGNGFLKDIAEGFRYARHHKTIWTLLAGVSAVSLGGRALLSIMPVIAAEWFGGGPTTLGVLLAALGAGAIVGGLCVASLATPAAKRFLLVSSIVATVLFVLLAAAVTQLWLGVVAIFGMGLAAAVNSILTQTALQLTADPSMNGRVISLYSMSMRAGPPLGAFLIGALGAVVDLRIVVAGFALLALLAAWPTRRLDLNFQ